MARSARRRGERWRVGTHMGRRKGVGHARMPNTVVVGWSARLLVSQARSSGVEMERGAH